jgi:hypothetical protein
MFLGFLEALYRPGSRQRVGCEGFDEGTFEAQII